MTRVPSLLESLEPNHDHQLRLPSSSVGGSHGVEAIISPYVDVRLEVRPPSSSEYVIKLSGKFDDHESPGHSMAHIDLHKHPKRNTRARYRIDFEHNGHITVWQCHYILYKSKAIYSLKPRSNTQLPEYDNIDGTLHTGFRYDRRGTSRGEENAKPTAFYTANGRAPIETTFSLHNYGPRIKPDSAYEFSVKHETEAVEMGIAILAMHLKAAILNPAILSRTAE